MSGPARRLSVGVIAVLLAAATAAVVLGMIAGADPEFDRGRSPTWTVIGQEAVGALTLLVLGTTALELTSVARGKGWRQLALFMFLSAASLFAWWVFLLLERAS